MLSFCFFSNNMVVVDVVDVDDDNDWILELIVTQEGEKDSTLSPMSLDSRKRRHDDERMKE